MKAVYCFFNLKQYINLVKCITKINKKLTNYLPELKNKYEEIAEGLVNKGLFKN